MPRPMIAPPAVIAVRNVWVASGTSLHRDLTSVAMRDPAPASWVNRAVGSAVGRASSTMVRIAWASPLRAARTDAAGGASRSLISAVVSRSSGAVGVIPRSTSIPPSKSPMMVPTTPNPIATPGRMKSAAVAAPITHAVAAQSVGDQAGTRES